MQPVILVCGVSGSGKSWACRQVCDKFNYIPHDRCWTHPHAKPASGIDPKWGPPGSKSTHVEEIEKAVGKSDKPILTECPFAERQIREKLESKGIKVIPVFVIEPPRVVAQRYQAREGKPLPKPAMTRASSILERANEWGAFRGTSKEVVDYLKEF